MILYLFAEIKCHNCYYSVCMKLKHMLPNYQARSPFVLKHTTSLIIYMFGRMYVILYFDPPYFCVRSAFDPVPNFTKQNPLVLRQLPVSP